ncbi:gliding motility-associated peptidyl-prolyl isomerase GldI [Cochleicola gelatinilyticus]|uniref:Peptidyl-prolyl cis-trans isomerase n=1 Tax=Cochleicola gelatinilyticus TaxID=1763537 RepID=A0A167HGP1_9FLAO|nr:gliding motility-associated peptidyl-prolyl isomerase GldI [Cochleicola gelatinilyticus]OAB78587.1 gliding motility-associated peptidyl-prolyl isomerase GldI [Cochleicola gelatinilyticus]
MMTRNLLIFILITSTFYTACKSPEARQPVQQTSGTFIEASADRNKKLYEKEKKQIQNIIQNDDLNSYVSSDSGFWYFYNEKDSISTQKPVFGDVVTFTYNVRKLNGETVVSETENGLQNYKIDQTNQELISGIRDGLKLMKEGETVTFLFPSYKAFGYYGIQNKLGANTPVQSTVTLKSIKQSQEN